MMPPYAFRRHMTHKSYSDANILDSAKQQKNKKSVFNYFYSGSESQVGVKVEHPTKQFEPKDFCYPVQSSQSLTRQNVPNTPSPSKADQIQLLQMLESLGIAITKRQLSPQRINDVMLHKLGPKMIATLSQNKQLTDSISQKDTRLRVQEDTIGFLKQENRMLLGRQRAANAKIEELVCEWRSKCDQVFTLSEEAEAKDQLLRSLTTKTHCLGQELNNLVLSEKEASHNRSELQLKYQLLKQQLQFGCRQRDLRLGDKERSLAEMEVRLRLVSQQAKLVSKKYQKCRQAHLKLVKESDIRERQLQSHTVRLQAELYSLSQENHGAQTLKYKTSETIQNLKEENNMLKDQLSEITDRFLRLTQFEEQRTA